MEYIEQEKKDNENKKIEEIPKTNEVKNNLEFKEYINNKYKDIEVIQNKNGDCTDYNLSFKIIVIGNSAVGKSSLVDSGIRNKFINDYRATVGFDYCSFFIRIEDKIIKLQVWDTCGQEVYQSLVSNFYRNSSLAIMVYAINDEKSFKNLDIWLKNLKNESNPDVEVILIGNKKDLESERKVSYEEAEKYAKDFNFVHFLETSAKTGFNAQKVFIDAAKILYDDYIEYEKFVKDNKSEVEDSDLGSTQLSKKSQKVNKNKGCCK